MARRRSSWLKQTDREWLYRPRLGWHAPACWVGLHAWEDDPRVAQLRICLACRLPDLGQWDGAGAIRWGREARALRRRAGLE